MDKKPYSYEFSPLAERDLNDIFDYISLELLSPQAAEQLIDTIQTAVEVEGQVVVIRRVLHGSRNYEFLL